jgi:hypothetical protein
MEFSAHRHRMNFFFTKNLINLGKNWRKESSFAQTYLNLRTKAVCFENKNKMKNKIRIINNVLRSLYLLCNFSYQ